MQKWILVLLTLLISAPLSAFACSKLPWEITECTAKITFDDDSVSTITLTPDPTQPEPIAGCWIGGCHPANCSSWPQNLKDSCANLWEKQRPLIMALSTKSIKHVAFEGCAEAPKPSNSLFLPLDWIGHHWTPRYFVTCTTDPEAAVWLHQKYGPIAKAQLAAILQKSKVSGTTLVNWLKGLAAPAPSSTSVPQTASGLEYQSLEDEYIKHYLPESGILVS